jgi:hypothetical protein
MLYKTQAIAVANPSSRSNPQHLMDALPNQLPPIYHHHTSPNTQQHPTLPPTTPSRILTSSNSFDSKSNLPNYAGQSGGGGCGPPFHMSVEASRLFQTLQQSPLPLPSNDVINYYC